MLILVLVLSILTMAIWTGINFFYGMVEIYLQSLGEGGGVVLEYLPILKVAVFAVVMSMLLGQAYVIKKRIDKEKPSTI